MLELGSELWGRAIENEVLQQGERDPVKRGSDRIQRQHGGAHFQPARAERDQHTGSTISMIAERKEAELELEREQAYCNESNARESRDTPRVAFAGITMSTRRKTAVAGMGNVVNGRRCRVRKCG